MKSKNVVSRFRQGSLTKRIAARFASEASAVSDTDLSRSQARGKATTKAYEDMKGLKTKVDNADPSAKKRFDVAYDKVFEGGQTAVKHADKLLKKVKVKFETEAWYAKSLLAKAVDDWEGNKTYHLKSKSESAGYKLRQAEQSWAYAQTIEDNIASLHRELSKAAD